MNDISSRSENATQGTDFALDKRDALIRVTRTLFGQEQTEEKYLEIRPFVTTPAQVTVAGSRTVNLGNYESAKIHVAVTLPCYKEELKEALDAVTKFVDAELTKRLEEADLLRGRGYGKASW